MASAVCLFIFCIMGIINSSGGLLRYFLYEGVGAVSDIGEDIPITPHMSLR
jgi:hypothetical protein